LVSTPRRIAKLCKSLFVVDSVSVSKYHATNTIGFSEKVK
jgi:hypothetical protein